MDNNQMNGKIFHYIGIKFVINTRHCNENCVHSNENNGQETILTIKKELIPHVSIDRAHSVHYFIL